MRREKTHRSKCCREDLRHSARMYGKGARQAAAKPGLSASAKGGALNGKAGNANAAKANAVPLKGGSGFVASKNPQHPGAKVGLGGVPNPQLAGGKASQTAKAAHNQSKSAVAKGALPHGESAQTDDSV